jgi:hypothetical protein
MPTYVITGPDGTEYEVEGQGTEEEALAALQAQLGAAKAPPDPMATLARETDPFEAAMVAAGSQFANLGEGARMIAGDVLGRPEWRTGAEADRSERERLMAPLKKESPWATGIGAAMPTMLVPGGAGRTLLGRALGSGLVSGGEAAVESGGNLSADVVMRTAAGIVGNELGARAGNYLLGSNRAERGPGLVSRLLGGDNPPPPNVPHIVETPEHNRMRDLAMETGVGLTPAQKFHNPRMAQVEASLARSPFFSGPFVKLAGDNASRANITAREAIGIGGTGPITDDVIDNARNVVGAEMQGILGSKAAFPITTDYFDAIDAVESSFGQGVTRGGRVRRIIDNMRDIGQRQYITVEEYQRSASDLAELARQNKNPEAKRAMYGLRSALDFEFEKAYGELPELRDAREKWRHIRGLELSNSVAGGDFNPSKYYAYMKNQGAGRVRGDSDIARLSEADRYFKAGAVPNSGTPTGQAVTDFANAGILGKAVRMAGGAISNTYMAAPGLVMGPGAIQGIPHAVRSVSDVLMPRLGRTTGSASVGAYDDYLNNYLREQPQ